jgi:hypothetical protein
MPLALVFFVRSKNKLALKMNGSDQSAIADITVFDVVKRFRLVVMEVCWEAHSSA